MKIACVVHRFGAEIAGGSEAHCRLVAQQLAAAHEVTVLTSCASDHVTWANHYPPGESRDGGVRVRRFPAARRRDLARFRDISRRVFSGRASAAEQDDWFRENGPEVPALVEHLRTHGGDYDRILFWAYRYYPVYFGLPLVADRAILVPTAEEDPLIHAPVLEGFFAQPRGYLFLTPEEAELVGARTMLPRATAVIGCGVEPSGAPRAAALPDGVADPFVLYLGRVDPNKGCDALLRYFTRYAAARGVRLVLAGPANMPLPDHPSIHALGYVADDVRDALLGRARALVMPSPYESLSMVLLEAWNRGIPALVNARCAVLRGQARRADGGLYYRNGGEFAAALDYLLDHPAEASQIGAQGRAYVDREYRWPAVLEKIERVLAATGPLG